MNEIKMVLLKDHVHKRKQYKIGQSIMVRPNTANRLITAKIAEKDRVPQSAFKMKIKTALKTTDLTEEKENEPRNS